nr:retrovirus-related Pol polyprotein from transposon TNT 1-94 [Tanacetum cinerariifolium]
LPFGKKAIGTKWAYRNKKDEKGVVVRNKARLVAQGHRQAKGIDYDECTIDEEVYVSQPPGFVDSKFPNMVYKVVKALYGLHQAPRACVKTTSTPIETQKPLVKDKEAVDVDVHLYRSLISSLMYLTASSPDILFAEIHNKRLSISWQETYFMAMQKADYCGYFYYRATLVKGRLLEVTTAKHSKELASPTQTALGKDESNPLIVDSLLKTIWSSMHHVIAMKHWLFQSKRLLFWSTAKVKTVNDEVRVQALIDGKKVTIKESSICHTLRLDDEEGTSCLANDDIFTGLANMGYEKMFDKLTFYKEVGQAQDDASIPTEPSTSKPHKKYKSNKPQPIAPKVLSPVPSPEHQLPSPSNDQIPTAKGFKEKSFKTTQVDIALPVEDMEKLFKYKRMIADMDEDVEVNLQEAQAKAYNLDLQQSEKVLQGMDEKEPAEVEEYQRQVLPRKRRGVIIQDPKETAASVIVHTEVKPKDKGKGILIEEPKPLKRQVKIKQVKAFARKDLKALWKLVKERFKTTEPKNLLDDFLLNILKIMFEKPDIEANVWKDQKGRYRVHIITLTTTQMILLVEKKYPLTHFTLQQMLENVRLEVEEESEMSLELLSLVRRQLNEGYVPE